MRQRFLYAALMFPSRGELSQYEVLFYTACPMFSSHSLRYWYCTEKAIISKIPFVAGFLHVNSGNLQVTDPVCAAWISTSPGQLPSGGRRLLRNLSV